MSISLEGEGLAQIIRSKTRCPSLWMLFCVMSCPGGSRLCLSKALSLKPVACKWLLRSTLWVPTSYDPETRQSLPALEMAALQVLGVENVFLTDEIVPAYRTILIYHSSGFRQQETCWYAVEAPHQLVKYDNGVEIYELVK